MQQEISAVQRKQIREQKKREKDPRRKPDKPLKLGFLASFDLTYHIGDRVGELCWQELKPRVLTHLRAQRVLGGGEIIALLLYFGHWRVPLEFVANFVIRWHH